MSADKKYYCFMCECEVEPPDGILADDDKALACPTCDMDLDELDDVVSDAEKTALKVH